jgi:hypothetical protein
MNFHLVIILNLEAQNHLPPAKQIALRDSALEAFRAILENQPSPAGLGLEPLDNKGEANERDK